MTLEDHLCSPQYVIIHEPPYNTLSHSAVYFTYVVFCLLCFECPHESPCPKLFQLPLVPCNFSQAYSPLPLPGVRDHSEGSDCIFWLLAYLTMCQQWCQQ